MAWSYCLLKFDRASIVRVRAEGRKQDIHARNAFAMLRPRTHARANQLEEWKVVRVADAQFLTRPFYSPARPHELDQPVCQGKRRGLGRGRTGGLLRSRLDPDEMLASATSAQFSSVHGDEIGRGQRDGLTNRESRILAHSFVWQSKKFSGVEFRNTKLNGGKETFPLVRVRRRWSNLLCLVRAVDNGNSIF